MFEQCGFKGSCFYLLEWGLDQGLNLSHLQIKSQWVFAAQAEGNPDTGQRAVSNDDVNLVGLCTQ